MRRGYQVHKALEKYGNKVVDLDKYPQWKVAMDLVTIISGVGRVPASSNSDSPCAEGSLPSGHQRHATQVPAQAIE
jgi:hypothetical protein